MGLYICIFSLTDVSKNKIKIIPLSENALRMHNVNKDELDKTTKLTGLTGMYYILIFPLPLSRNISIVTFFYLESQYVLTIFITQGTRSRSLCLLS